MRIFSCLFLVLVIALQTLQTPLLMASSPSSAIPERREFPTSTKINPCENFYEYACSEVIQSFSLRPDRSSHVFSFSDSRERLLAKKKDYLVDLGAQQVGGKSLSPRAADLATVFNACMNPAARQTEEKALLASTLKELAALKSRPAFLDFIAAQRRAGVHSFVDVDSLASQDDPERNDFLFVASMMKLPERSYYQKPAVTKDYEAYVKAFFELIGAPAPRQRAKAVVRLESAFAMVQPLPAEMREIYSQRSAITPAQLLQSYPTFRLDQELARVPATTTIRHLLPKTFAWVDNTLATAKLEDLKDLYTFQALAGKLDAAYPEFFAKGFAFSQKHLGGPAVRPELSERCTELVMHTFTRELDAELLPRLFPDFPEADFVALAESVRAAIIAGVETNGWLSAQGKTGAIAKLKAAKLQLVKPRTEAEWYFNPKVTYTADKPLANLAELTKALTERMFKELPEPRNRDRWAMGPLTVNAYYSAEDNKFVMPIGILQYPFYDPREPLLTNLGAVGAVIGHELGHGIDDQGAKYDATGKLNQWLSEDDLKAFKSRGQNLVQQFDAIGHNGQLTLGENIGDLTGVTFAYKAAFPGGVGETKDKRAFFLQYARVWCGVERPKYSEAMLKTDPHSRGWARVNQQVKNQPAFAEAYACKAGDPMTLAAPLQAKVW